MFSVIGWTLGKWVTLTYCGLVSFFQPQYFLTNAVNWMAIFSLHWQNLDRSQRVELSFWSGLWFYNKQLFLKAVAHMGKERMRMKGYQVFKAPNLFSIMQVAFWDSTRNPKTSDSTFFHLVLNMPQRMVAMNQLSQPCWRAAEFSLLILARIRALVNRIYIYRFFCYY